VKDFDERPILNRGRSSSPPGVSRQTAPFANASFASRAIPTNPQSQRQTKLAGFLHKRGYWNSAWRRRYFELSPHGELRYFETAGAAPNGEPRGAIPIAMPAGCTGGDNETLVRPAGRDGSLYLLEIQVQGPGPAQGRTFNLAADNRAERDRWVTALHAVATAWRVRPGGAAAPEQAPGGLLSAGRDLKLANALADLDRLHGAGTVSRDDYRARKAQLLRNWQADPQSKPAAAAAGAAAAAAGSGGAWEMEGMLWKRGGMSTGWQERYCVLTARGDLEYYAAPDGAPYGPPRGVVSVALRPGCQGDTESTVVRAGGRDGAKALLQVGARCSDSTAIERSYCMRGAATAQLQRSHREERELIWAGAKRTQA
jgi:hypothetical protein